MTRLLQFTALFAALSTCASQTSADTVTFTTDETIGCDNMMYEGDDIIVSGCIVTIDCAHSFASLSVINGGIVTHAAGGTVPGGAEDPVGMVLTITGNVLVDAGCSISADGRGHPAGAGDGAGTDSDYGGGGGAYGGRGGYGQSGGIPGWPYGSPLVPTALGSGGGNGNGYSGGAGGGAIELTVLGSATIDGTVAANGTDASGYGAWSGGGGSGGSISLDVAVLEGAGTIAANGGNKSGTWGGGGGGGRVAVYAATSTFSGDMTACGGYGESGYAGAGTVYTEFQSPNQRQLLIDNCGNAGGCTEWTEPALLAGDLLVTGGGIVCHFPEQPLILTVSGNVLVDTGCWIYASGRGYPAGTGPGGGGGGDYGGSGGGYGGSGGRGLNAGAAGLSYGSQFVARELGSGGGNGHGYTGGTGGGTIELSVVGTLTVDGTLAANGANASGYGSWGGGGGSGGGIQLDVGSLGGTGTIEADGGSGGGGWGGGGGGGRIAIYTASCDVGEFGGVVTAVGGSGYRSGAPGTVQYGIIGAPPVGIVTTVGAIEERDPSQDLVTDISPGNWESSDHIRVFVEQIATPLPGQLTVDVSVPGVYDEESDLSPDIIPGGWIVNSHVLHLDSVGGDPVSLGGSVTFDTPVLGVILTDGNLDDSEEVDYGTWTQRVLARRDLTYPYGVPGRGVELDGPEGDTVTLSSDRLTVTFDGFTDSAIDQIRIITSGHLHDYDEDNVPDECEPAAANVLMVDDDAQGANDGSSWDDAFNSLQDALAAAETAGGTITEVWIAAGTYWPDDGGGQTLGNRSATFSMLSNLALYGGFGGWEVDSAQRDWKVNETILSGDIGIADDDADNSYHVVTAGAVDATATLDGVTISGGKADGGDSNGYGAGFYNDASNPTLTHCIFTENSAGVHGGGLFNDGHPTVIDCTFVGNSANRGAGITNHYDSSLTLTDSTLSGNSSLASGGGIYNDVGSTPTIVNCVFFGNSSPGSGDPTHYGGGAINNYASSGMLVNCIFSGNSANNGGAISNFDSNPTLTNCVFSSNVSTTTGGIWNTSGSVPSVLNCVLWGNTPTQIVGAATVSYSCVQGGWPGDGNVDGDPLFVDSDGVDNLPGTVDDNLRLLPTSPCVDAANNTGVPGGVESDLDGLARFVDDPLTPDTGVPDPPDFPFVVDMGAYEYVAGDLDWDGSAGAADWAIFADCMAGPDVSVPPAAVTEAEFGKADLVGDDDVDLADFAAFQQVFGQPQRE